jgi:hypothetical protein
LHELNHPNPRTAAAAQNIDDRFAQEKLATLRAIQS